MSLDLDAIKARLAAACPGPWKGGTLRDPLSGDCLMLMREDDPRTIAATLRPQYGDNDTATMLLHSRGDMDALVAEVERLRALVVSIVENVVEAQTGDELVLEERAAVIAHLRERAEHGAGHVMSVEDTCTILADLFERGEHRREEGA